MFKPAIGGQYDLTASLVKISTLLGIDDDIRLKGEITFPPTRANIAHIQMNTASSNVINIPASTAFSTARRTFSAGSILVSATTPGATDVVIVDCSIV
jgi:hypothetical protein